MIKSDKIYINSDKIRHLPKNFLWAYKIRHGSCPYRRQNLMPRRWVTLTTGLHHPARSKFNASNRERISSSAISGL